MFDIRKASDLAYEEMLELYMDLHRHPELGFAEERTAGVVADYLEGLGLTVRKGIAGTGVVGILKGRQASASSRTVLLRADMDGLPIQEETGLPFASVHPGVMHACGHDAHTAMLLVTARILAEQADSLDGTVLFVFEPNEEVAGARAMIDTGVLDDFSVDACLALHLWSPLPTGTVGLVSGGVMAGMDEFHITLTGKAGHTGAPHLSVDPVLAAADVVQGIQALQTREIDPLSRTVIMVGRIQAGTACNAIPEQAFLDGTVRYLYDNDPEGQERPLERFRDKVRAIAAVHGVGCDISFVHSNRTVLNDEGLVRTLRAGVESLAGKDNIVEERSLAGEDFSEFSDVAPVAFLFVGCGNAELNTCFPHHHPRFAVDPAAMKLGVRLHLANVFAVLTA